MLYLLQQFPSHDQLPDGRIEWTTFDENGNSEYCGTEHPLTEEEKIKREACEDFMKLLEEV